MRMLLGGDDGVDDAAAGAGDCASDSGGASPSRLVRSMAAIIFSFQLPRLRLP